MSGSGRLAVFTVYAPLPGKKLSPPHSGTAVVVWQIKATKGYLQGTRVESIHLIYGKLPDMYSQVIPNASQEPPRLPAGAVYSFFAETTDAPGIGGYFYMGAAGPVQISIPDLCVREVAGREVAVKCGTNDTYSEPANLDKFVEEHLVEGR